MSPQSLCEKEAFLRPSCFFCSRPNKFPTRVPPSSIQRFSPPSGLDRLCIFTQISALVVVGRSMKSRTNFSLSLLDMLWHTMRMHDTQRWASWGLMIQLWRASATITQRMSALWQGMKMWRYYILIYAIIQMSREPNVYVITRFSPLHLWLKFQGIRCIITAISSRLKTNQIYIWLRKNLII